MTTTTIAWEQRRYESGWYSCKVTRNGDSVGQLTVTLLGNTDHLLHSESVKCDRTDTDRWRTLSLAVITNPDLRNIEP